MNNLLSTLQGTDRRRYTKPVLCNLFKRPYYTFFYFVSILGQSVAGLHKERCFRTVQVIYFCEYSVKHFNLVLYCILFNIQICYKGNRSGFRENGKLVARKLATGAFSIEFSLIILPKTCQVNVHIELNGKKCSGWYLK